VLIQTKPKQNNETAFDLRQAKDEVFSPKAWT